MELNLESFELLHSSPASLSCSKMCGLGSHIPAEGWGSCSSISKALPEEALASALTQFHQAQLCWHEHSFCCIFNCRNVFTWIKYSSLGDMTYFFMGRWNNHRFVFLFHVFQLFSVRQGCWSRSIGNPQPQGCFFFSPVNNHILIKMTGSCCISMMKPLTFRSVEQFWQYIIYMEINNLMGIFCVRVLRCWRDLLCLSEWWIFTVNYI